MLEAIRVISFCPTSSLYAYNAWYVLRNHAGTPAADIRSPAVRTSGKPYGNNTFLASSKFGLALTKKLAGIATAGPIPGTISNAKLSDEA